MALDEIMEFDRVVEVKADGTVIAGPAGIYGPEVSVDLDDQGRLVSPDLNAIHITAPWQLINGYSQQAGYRGPIMHASEVIGGYMEREILARPGLYVAVVVIGIKGAQSGSGNADVGWAVAYRPA